MILSIYASVVLMFVINTGLDHLFNWWFRLHGYDSKLGPFVFIGYIIKILIFVSILQHLL